MHTFRVFCLSLLLYQADLLMAQSGIPESLEIPLDANPGFQTQKIDLPGKKVYIKGQGYGRFLVCCSDSDAPDCERRRREYYWISRKSNGDIDIAHAKLPVEGLQAIASVDSFTLLYSVCVQHKPQVLEARLNAKGNIVSEQPLIITDPAGRPFRAEIRHPFVYTEINTLRKWLYFSAVNGQNGYDIFWARREGTAWVNAQPLNNPSINTITDEDNPRLNRNGQLFFTSNRPINEVSQWNKFFALPGETFGEWQSAEVNPLPEPFNFPSRGGVVPAGMDLDEGFFTRDDDGESTLYSFKNTLPAQPQGTFRALIIAAEDYHYPAMGKLRDGIRTSRALADVLSRKFCFEIDTLFNPTADEIRHRLEQYQNLGENESFLVTFMGHGFPVFGMDSTIVGGYLYGVDGQGNGTGGVSNEEFRRLFAKIARPTHLFAAIDACFAGDMFRGPKDNGAFNDRKSRRAMASTFDVLAPDHSYFFRFFIEALEQLPGTVGTSLYSTEVFEYIQKQMASERVPEDKRTIPDLILLGGHKGGNFRFVICR